MPEIQGLDTEALERMADALVQPEIPAVEGAGVEPLRVGELRNGMTPAPAIEVDGDLIVLGGVKSRLHAFLRCVAAASPKNSVVGDLGALEMAASVSGFKDATARLSPTAILSPVEGGEQLVVYMARPGKEASFEELVPDFMEDDTERRAVLTDEKGKPLAVVFGPKREKQAAPAVSAPAAGAPGLSEAPVPISADAPLPDWLTSLRSSPAEPEPSAAPVAPSVELPAPTGTAAEAEKSPEQLGIEQFEEALLAADNALGWLRAGEALNNDQLRVAMVAAATANGLIRNLPERYLKVLLASRRLGENRDYTRMNFQEDMGAAIRNFSQAKKG